MPQIHLSVDGSRFFSPFSRFFSPFSRFFSPFDFLKPAPSKA